MADERPSGGFLHNQGVFVSILLMVVAWVVAGSAVAYLHGVVARLYFASEGPLSLDQISDVAFGVGCLAGLVAYYGVCRPTEKARRVGSALGGFFLVLDLLFAMAPFSVSPSLNVRSISGWTVGFYFLAFLAHATYIGRQNHKMLRLLYGPDGVKTTPFDARRGYRAALLVLLGGLLLIVVVALLTSRHLGRSSW